MRKDTISIIRFLGTSASSSDIYSIFKSIQEQLETIFEIDTSNREYQEYKAKGNFGGNILIIDENHEDNKKKEDFKNKLHYFSEKCLKAQNKHLVILLDSIDQLNEKNHNLKWFFNEVPKNVKIIYSVLKDFKNIFENLKKEIKNEGNVLEILPLEKEQAKIILSSYMNATNRKLTNKQEISINNMINGIKDVTPLLIKLIFDIVSKWKSSYEISDEFLDCKNSIDVIKYLFRTIEKYTFDNEILFKRCLFYLTLFEYRGISENELEDVLSIDDEVLTSIFVHHHPPVRRFPMSLWCRIKYELKDFITNKMTDDVLVVAW